jgi:hypothetical protein
MKQDLARAMDCFEQLMMALQDLDLGHIAVAVQTLQEQTVEELEVDIGSDRLYN